MPEKAKQLAHDDARELRALVQDFQAADAKFTGPDPHRETREGEDGLEEVVATHSTGEPGCDIPQAEEYLRARKALHTRLGELEKKLGL